MTHFRLRWQKLGGHVHVGVWSGTEPQTTHGCNGRLAFRENEWADLVQLIEVAELAPLVEIVHESEPLS